LESAVKALNSLTKADITEVKSFTNPPNAVRVVMEAVCVLLGEKETWEVAKKLLGRSDFIDLLQNYDKDNIDPKVIKKLTKYIKDPEFTPEAAVKATPIEPTTAGLNKAWPAVLEHLQNANRMAWIVVTTASVREYDGDVVTLVFPSETDAASFRPQPGVPGGVHEKLRESIIAVTGESPKFRVSVEGTPTAAIDTVPAAKPEPAEKPSPVVVPDAPGDDWAVVDIPGADEASTGSAGEGQVSTGSTGAVSTSSTGEVSTSSTSEVSTGSASDDGRYGESVVRDLLGATLLKEERTGPIETVPPADTGAQVLPNAGEA
jgi:hypothetical protein